jgi:hypothetical protein
MIPYPTYSVEEDRARDEEREERERMRDEA